MAEIPRQGLLALAGGRKEEEGSLNGFSIFTITDRQGPGWLQVSRHDGCPCLGLGFLPVPEEFRAPVAFRAPGLPLVLSPWVALCRPWPPVPVETSDLPTGPGKSCPVPCQPSRFLPLIARCEALNPVVPCQTCASLVLPPFWRRRWRRTLWAWVRCRWSMTVVDRDPSDGCDRSSRGYAGGVLGRFERRLAPCRAG